MQAYVYDQAATRVIFGAGSLERLAEEVKRLGAHRPIVLSTPEQRADAEQAARRLGDMTAAIYAQAVMHVPIETARGAREVAKAHDADCYVAIGGGSTIGFGKAMRIGADALGERDAAQGLYDLAARLDAPLALKGIGMPADGLDRAAKLATENPYYNPRAVEHSGVRRLLENAYHGKRPGAS
jgi:alcohol dehydrogenase class IV